MSEPLFENDADRIAEAEIIAAVSALWKCDYRKLPIKNRIDYALLRNGAVKVLAEARDRREYTMEQLDGFGGVLLSADKALYGFGMCELTSVDFYFIVRCCSGAEIWYADLKRDQVKSWKFGVFKGNHIPRREGDKELCFEIPAGQFKRII